MVLHIVLFRPKPSVSDSDRAAMFEALHAAATGIPAVRRFHIGNRIKHGRPYEQLMTDDYPFAAVVEFEDLAGLKTYLNHPRHERLGELFYQLLEAALVYDYETGPVA
jgi:stress responsive alpha/beta barrel protein